MVIMDMNDDMADQQPEDILLPDPVDSYNAQSNSEIENMSYKFNSHSKTTTSSFLNTEETCDKDGDSPKPNTLIDLGPPVELNKVPFNNVVPSSLQHHQTSQAYVPQHLPLQTSSSTTLRPSTQSSPTQVEIQMYNMLRHLTSRM